jgi:hypothetical protein
VINTKRLFKKRFHYAPRPSSEELADQWRGIEASRQQWEQEEAELRERTNLVIREWETEFKPTMLYAGPDPDDAYPAHAGVVTPSMVRDWIWQRSGIDTIVELDMGARQFWVTPLHPEKKLELSLRSVPE